MIGIVGRILVIDDCDRDRKMLRDALVGEGYSFEAAAVGPDGLRVLFVSRPDSVVLDVLMPTGLWSASTSAR